MDGSIGLKEKTDCQGSETENRWGECTLTKVRLKQLRRNPYQPRKVFHQSTIQALAATMIPKKDVDNPIKLASREKGKIFIVVDGERRWRAAEAAGLTKISALVRENMSDEEIAMESARSFFCKEDITPLEKAMFISSQLQLREITQTQFAEEAGLTTDNVSKLLKLLDLIEPLQQLILKRELPFKLALELAGIPKDKQQETYQSYQTEVGKRGGKPMTAEESVMHVRRVAERKKIVPKNTGSRPQKTHAELVMGVLYRDMKTFEKALTQLGLLTGGELNSLRDPYASQLLSDLRRLQRLLQVKVQFVEENAN